MWIKREIENILESNQEVIVILLGPRQCGKSSTLLHVLGEDWVHITFDDLSQREKALGDPEFFLSQFAGKKLLIDEAQYAPPLFSEIKRMVDAIKLKKRLSKESQKSYPAQICLTGSNRVFLEKNVQESLAGRASYFDMLPLSVSEVLRWKMQTDLYELQFKGGWPEIHVEELGPVTYLNNYIRTVFERDIIAANGISKASDFLKLSRLLANRTGELLNFDSLSKECGVSSNTIREWVSLLERMNVIGLLNPYSTNLNKRLTKQAKIYFLDTGLAIRLQGYSSLESFKSSPRLGQMFETLVYSEIIKTKQNHQLSFDLYLWRTKDQEEIDFILLTPGKVILLEVKMAIQASAPFTVPRSLPASFSGHKIVQALVTFGGEKQKLTREQMQIPIRVLSRFILSEILEK